MDPVISKKLWLKVENMQQSITNGKRYFRIQVFLKTFMTSHLGNQPLCYKIYLGICLNFFILLMRARILTEVNMQTNFTTEIDNLGRVSLAPELLSTLRLSPGTTLLLEIKDGKIVLEPLPEEPELVEKDGLLFVRPRITGNLVDFVQQEREERIANLAKGV
jgi:bifunctional DNA-binding transcriptional regulator/antitoxin component of YhaV-PrlF toxin-antitoxin module